MAETGTREAEVQEVDRAAASVAMASGGGGIEAEDGERVREVGADEQEGRRAGQRRRWGDSSEEEEDYGEDVGADPDLENQFAGMRLHGKEEEDLDFSAEVDDLVKDVRWLALFRVHTTKPFSHAALLSQMRNAWMAAQGVTFNIKGPNLFLVQCHCLGDWRKIMEGGPWLCRRAPMVMQEYDGFSDVNEYPLNMIPVWIRVKGLPDGLTRKRQLAEKVAAKVGDPPFKLIVNEGRINPSSTLRARVFVDVNVSLVRFVHITLKERKKYNVFYEKLPDFCFACGLMGHLADECGMECMTRDLLSGGVVVVGTGDTSGQHFWCPWTR